ncbi:Epithelial splicing regulatory protein 1 [Symbiodinium microadriaticum]|uniref:Epithelial splicing regulatory protein 1 n=1 Tax=Symbiodinium microadriaticum TaxID=2951 RepID=A0A1Q9DGF1_SYMMI|nr:Epithelial splicing regulatory protein 1 [Symbiodinium microadriaticum]
MMQNPPSEALFITGLPKDCTNDFARSIFGQYGTVKDVNVLPVLAGKEAAAAIVTMTSVDDAKWIVEHVNGNVPQSLVSPVTVQFAAPKSGGKGMLKGAGVIPFPAGMGGGMAGKGAMMGGAAAGGKGGMMDVMQLLVSALGGLGGGALAGMGGGGDWGAGAWGGGGKGWGGGGGKGTGKATGARPPSNNCLRLQGLPFSATEDEVRAFFTGYQMTGRIHLKMDDSGRPSGIGFVEFVSAEEAKRAYTEKNFQTIGTRYVELMEAMPRDIDLYLNHGGIRAF